MIGVWCTISINHITGPIFYEGTLDAEWYSNEILKPFFVNLAPAEDLVILCKMAQLHKQLRKQSENYTVFGEFNGEDIIISKCLWPPRSPDLNPCDYLWGKLKHCVRQQSTWPVRSKTIFVKQFTTFSNVNCKQVSRNLFKRILACLAADGRHFEYLLWWWVQY
jgi:hypothetical protein